MLYENTRVEEIKVDFNNEVQSDDEFIGRSHSLQEQWSASVASVCAEIASFDPRLYGTVRSEKKKQIYAAKEKKWSNIPSLPFDDSEVALARREIIGSSRMAGPWLDHGWTVAGP